MFLCKRMVMKQASPLKVKVNGSIILSKVENHPLLKFRNSTFGFVFGEFQRPEQLLTKFEQQQDLRRSETTRFRSLLKVVERVMNVESIEEGKLPVI